VLRFSEVPEVAVELVDPAADRPCARDPAARLAADARTGEGGAPPHLGFLERPFF
jgi:hypothetical protein